MTPYFEKTLRRVVQEIKYTLFFILSNKIFNIDIYSICLIVVSLLLLLDVIAFIIS